MDKTHRYIKYRVRHSVNKEEIRQRMLVTFDPALSFESYYYLPYIKYANLNAYASIDQYAETYAEKTTPSTQSTQNTQNTQSSQSTQSTQTTQTTQETQSTQSAQQTALTTDYNTLIETLKLYLPENKFAILRLLPATELIQFLSLLDKDQLLNGLQLFTKDKILQFISNIPQEDLLKLLFKIFISKDEILDMLPIKELNHFLSSKKIEKTDLLKIFETLSRTELAQIAEAATGIAQGNKSQVQMLDYLKGLETVQLLDGIKGLEYKKMRGVVSELLKLRPELYMEFNQTPLFEETINVPKTSLIQGMSVLQECQLVNMVSELPQSFLALAVSQINTELLAQILVNNYQNLLSNISINNLV